MSPCLTTFRRALGTLSCSGPANLGVLGFSVSTVLSCDRSRSRAGPAVAASTLSLAATP